MKLFGEEVPFERTANQIGPVFIQDVDMGEVLQGATLLNRNLLLFIIVRDDAPQRFVDLQFAQFLEVPLIAVGEEITEVLQDDDDVVVGEVVSDLSVFVRFEKELQDDIRVGLVHGFHQLRIDVWVVETGEDRFQLLVAEDSWKGTGGIVRHGVRRGRRVERRCRWGVRCRRWRLSCFNTGLETNTSINRRMHVVLVLDRGRCC